MTRAFWITGSGHGDILPAGEGEGDILVEALYSGISRGTEALVFAGSVPAGEHQRMRCPFQEGSFGFPLKYGYAAVGIVRDETNALNGRMVFALHPHQDRFRLPADAVRVVPDTLPAGRAVLAANMETALNIVWDAEAGPGDRISVVGAGVVGSLVAWLAARLPGAEVELIDVNPDRIDLARALGLSFALPEEAAGERDIVVHASGHGAGLQSAIDLAGHEARIVEASWYGDRSIEMSLGGAFHSRRLRIVGSQVGAVPASRRARWDFARRMEVSLKLLSLDDRLDALISGETAFEDMPANYRRILGDPATLCHRIRYRSEKE